MKWISASKYPEIVKIEDQGPSSLVSVIFRDPSTGAEYRGYMTKQNLELEQLKRSFESKGIGQDSIERLIEVSQEVSRQDSEEIY